ncbi:MAG: VOC family protein [Marinibacterium sp.]
MTTLRAMPVLQVSEVTASEAFYRRLGFDSHGIWGDPPAFCIVQRGNVTLALDQSRGGDLPVNQFWAAYIYVDDAAALHDEFSALDLPEITALHRDNPYGCHDFTVMDRDGHRLGFGQSLDPVPGPGLNRGRGRG